MTEKNNAALYDIDLMIQAGFDPKKVIPKNRQYDTPVRPQLKEDIRRVLRILDEQNAVRRFCWYNLPDGLTGELMERILYYRGQGAFFYLETDNSFYFLPFALDSGIDVYGRFMSITPLPFNGTTNTSEEKDNAFIIGLSKIPQYQVSLEMNADDMLNKCVILRDYVQQIGQTNIPRQTLQEPILDAMAEAFPLARTSLISNSGVKGMRVNDEDQKANVLLASNSITNAALSGKPWIPIVGNIEFQELTEGAALKSEEFLLYMQALDNFRLSLYGLKNGGLFQKKAHMLEAEQEMNDGNVGMIYQDSLTLRQEFCNIVNSIWGLSIWVEPSETVLGIDYDQDGDIDDDTDQSGEYGSHIPNSETEEEPYE